MSATRNAPGPLAILLSLLWDVGLALGAYFAARWAGADDYLALLAGSVVALLRVGYVAARTRRFDAFAAVMVGVFGIGLLLSLLTGDARFLLVKESFATAAAGLAFLGSCLVGRPLIYHVALRMYEGKPAEIAEFETKWQTVPAFRRNFRLMSAVWGAGLLIDAALRVPVVYLLPTSSAVSASSGMFVAALVLLTLWNIWFVRRIQHSGAASAQPVESRSAAA